jgi:hypothetical protein
VTARPRLPSRFPVGTRHIIEGEPRKGAQLRIVSRSASPPILPASYI